MRNTRAQLGLNPVHKIGTFPQLFVQLFAELKVIPKFSAATTPLIAKLSATFSQSVSSLTSLLQGFLSTVSTGLITITIILKNKTINNNLREQSK